MKNLALIIGISNYQTTSQQLPACKNDADLIEKILRLGGTFTDIHKIEQEDSESVKHVIQCTLERYRDEDIGTLLFYFSGHGKISEDDFLFQLSDFNEQHQSSTSIVNSQLDRQLLNLGIH